MTFALCPRLFARGSAAALTMVLALTLSGCDDNSPVAAPTSTLPAPASQPTPTVPPYETDLDLSAEEKEAVEGALVGLDGYILFTNELYRSGGKKITGVDLVTTGDSLVEVEESSTTLIKEEMGFEGEVTLKELSVTQVIIARDNRKVLVEACSPSSTYNFINSDGSIAQNKGSEESYFEFTLVELESSWKVSKQSLIGESCTT